MSILSRRQWLQNASGGMGAIALAGILAEQARSEPRDPMAPRSGHFPAKADRVIFLYSTGGVSQVDTFDPKPELTKRHGQTITAMRWLNKPGKFERFLVKSRFAFEKRGKSGIPTSELFPHIGSVIDELCVLNAMVADSDGHDKGTLAAHTGSAQFTRPSVGSWVSYGLGTPNRNLPSFMVLAPKAPYAGAQTWGADFLPGCHQGTLVVPGPDPLPHVRRPASAGPLQEMELGLLARLNQRHQASRAADQALEARIRSFETAFGMQAAAPEAFDLSRESAETLRLYGLEPGTTSGFGWQCLVARRLAERGVRFLELIDVGSSSSENWDSHGNMADHIPLAKKIDQPIAALITDLKRRGMLDSTLVVWTTEFGRTPFNATKDHPGREHHNLVFTSWMAGGGVKAGVTHGKSDELGIFPTEGQVHTHDLHATMLHLLGLDHERLTFRHAGRDYRLTDVAGEVVKPVLG